MTHTTALALGAAVAAGVGVAAVGGFLVGYRVADGRPERLLRRAGRDTGRCLDEASAAIDLAGRFCDAVAGTAKATERQLAALADRQSRLAESIGRLLSRGRFPAPHRLADMEWQREPLDPDTQLPGRAGFEANVLKVAAVAVSPHGGVLLVSLDGIERLRRRVGDAGLAELRRAVARVLCRAGREPDLACVVDSERFAVLLGDADPEDALRQAAVIRDTFRGHPFRLGTDGPEVLVTASYGFTPVLPGDEVGLILDRAEAAVTRSRRWGRNRLYAYDSPAARLVQVPDATPTAPLAAAPT